LLPAHSKDANDDNQDKANGSRADDHYHHQLRRPVQLRLICTHYKRYHKFYNLDTKLRLRLTRSPAVARIADRTGCQ